MSQLTTKCCDLGYRDMFDALLVPTYAGNLKHQCFQNIFYLYKG